MKITKLLSLESRPAQTLLARAKKVVLSYADRVKTPAELTIDGVVYENALGDVRPLEVDDVLVDEKGAMYVVAAGEDKVMHVTGDHELMQEAVYAFVARGIRVANSIKGGQIYVNHYFSKGMIESPGTGWKESGLGVAGMQKYMISKTVFVETIDGTLPPV